MNNDWMDEASCAVPVSLDDGLDPVIVDFYSKEPSEIDKAKALCSACPVKLLCLQSALDRGERWGYHGGADESELRRAQGINAFGEPANPKTAKKIRCPNCKAFSTKNVEIIERKRSRTHVACTECDVHWWVKRGLSTKKQNW